MTQRILSPRFTFSSLPLGRKVALIPALTLLLLVIMLAVGMQMGERNTAALRALDHDVFDPLSRAQNLKDQVTLLHSHLFALLSLGTNEANSAAQKAGSDALLQQLDANMANFDGFLSGNAAVDPSVASRLRQKFDDYVSQFRDTANFAAYDASYGALIAGGANERFGTLRADLDGLVRLLAQRRASLASEAVRDSVAAQKMLAVLGLGATVITLLGSVAVGRSIARPVLRLTAMMNRLAAGDTELAVPGTQRRDEVGAMARAVGVFRANQVARREAELSLRRTNFLFDAALNSMLQGMIVWGPDQQVQLVNNRFYEVVGLPQGCITTGLSPRDVAEIVIGHGLHPGSSVAVITGKITAVLSARCPMRFEQEMSPSLIVQVASQPMANGGAVVTFEDITEKRQKEAQIVFMARHDALTGLPNRTLFKEHMEAMLQAGEQAQSAGAAPFGVLCLDLDHFKEVNDTLGHPAGDELLRQVATRLRDCVRDGDMIARLGGDEFAIVLAGRPGGAPDAASLASRLVASVSAPYEVQGHNIVIGTSIGIALSDPGLSSADMLKRADVALYRAKEERGTFAFFEPGMDRHLQARLGMEADLRLALHRGEFELNYQPLYSLAEDRVTGLEALIRWNSPTRGRVAPNEFIPLAEQSGLIIPIGEWVLRAACIEAAAWPNHVRVAVNLSVIQTRNRHLVELVRDALQRSGLPARRLELEITESVLLQDTEAVMAMLHSLHEMGVRVSMDDFGTGYSSLSYLRRFPFDKIKIDRSFISDLRGTADPSEGAGDATANTLAAAAGSAATIVRAIVGLGRNLGISTTAEGVETAQQFAQARQNGCAEVQGYFISPPRPADEVVELLRRLDATLPAIAKRGVVTQELVA